MKIETGKKYNIYIGLTTQNFKVLDSDIVRNITAENLYNIGINAFNTNISQSAYKGVSENALKVSFINTFGVKEKAIIKVLDILKKAFNQECILIESIETIKYAFV